MQDIYTFLLSLSISEVDAILLTAGIAAGIAIWGIFSQRATARRQVTASFIWNSEADEDLIKARQTFIELSKVPTGLAEFAEHDREADTETQRIRLILNELELISISIQLDIMDFDLYYKWHRSSVIEFWDIADPFIRKLRKRSNNDKLYNEFEKMYQWMKGEKAPPRKLKRIRRKTS